MYHRTIMAITVALTAVLAATPALARTEALLVGLPDSGGSLAGLGSSLKAGFGIEDVEISLPRGPHDIATRVREFLGSDAKPGVTRLLWVADDNIQAICPGFDEPSIRPTVRTLVIAPTCIKLLIQPPTTYERLGGENSDDHNRNDQSGPEVAFISAAASSPGDQTERLAKPSGSLAQTFACSHSGRITLDFSPSIASWGVDTAACRPPAQVAAASRLSPAPASPTAATTATNNASDPPPPPKPAATRDVSFRLSLPIKGRLVSGFGSDAGGKPNKGEDIEAASGTAVRAAQAGEVVYVGELQGFGQVIAIKHDNDWATVYAHTEHPRVVQGQKVQQGQDLADLDPAGKLHFELRHKGKPVDPQSLMATAS